MKRRAESPGRALMRPQGSCHLGEIKELARKQRKRVKNRENGRGWWGDTIVCLEASLDPSASCMSFIFFDKTRRHGMSTNVIFFVLYIWSFIYGLRFWCGRSYQTDLLSQVLSDLKYANFFHALQHGLYNMMSRSRASSTRICLHTRMPAFHIHKNESEWNKLSVTDIEGLPSSYRGMRALLFPLYTTAYLSVFCFFPIMLC